MPRDQHDGETAYISPHYTERLAQQSTLRGLSTQIEPTPDPGGDGERGGGLIRRANEFRSGLNPVALESIGLRGMEISKAIRKRADELYRNQFPRFEPAFTRKCRECGTEFDEEIDSCEMCNGPTREPSHQQRTEAEAFFESVNREGQSLRSLYKFLARDAGRLGVWTHIVKKRYAVLNGSVIEDVQELVRADPKRVKPVVDENGRIGGHWWACPIHRPPHEDGDCSDKPGECEHCGADLREVHFAEVEEISDDEPAKVYFEDEVIDHAPFEPRLAGHDGLSPIASIWLKQAILEWMDLYAGGFYDQNNTNRFPGKMGFIHTTNKAAVEKQLEMAQDEKDEDAYAQGFIYNEVPHGSDSTDKVQVIDMMSDEILGQSDKLKKDYKSDIRSVYGLTDAQDSELGDAGGLNNEGLQLEVNDREKAAAQQALREGPLRKLMAVLGYTDWQLVFVPPQREEEAPSTLETVQAAATAKQNGIPFQIEDGRIEVLDTDGPADVDDPEARSGDPDDGPSTNVQPPDVSPNLQASGVDAAVQQLERMQRDLVWGDGGGDVGLEQQAEAFFADDKDMPEFVKDLLEQALQAGAIYSGEYDAPNVTGGAVRRFFEDKLGQPQGWSRRSLIEDFADRFQISEQQAADTLETQLTNVLNKAREQGYERQGETDDRLFKWVGPADDDKTEACWELLQETNPRYGGTPRPLDELKGLVEQKREEHYPEFGGSEWSVHWGERDTFVEHFD